MEVTRIHEGLWRWAVRRDGLEMASAYLEHGDAMLLVDPVLPPPGDDLDRFARAIERDRARLGGPAWVLLTRQSEPRAAEAVGAMAGAQRWAHGHAPPPGMEVLATGRPGEVALWSPTHGALMPGVALAVGEDGPVAARGVDAAALLGVPAAIVIPAVGPMWTRA